MATFTSRREPGRLELRARQGLELGVERLPLGLQPRQLPVRWRPRHRVVLGEALPQLGALGRSSVRDRPRPGPTLPVQERLGLQVHVDVPLPGAVARSAPPPRAPTGCAGRAAGCRGTPASSRPPRSCARRCGGRSRVAMALSVAAMPCRVLPSRDTVRTPVPRPFSPGAAGAGATPPPGGGSDGSPGTASPGGPPARRRAAPPSGAPPVASWRECPRCPLEQRGGVRAEQRVRAGLARHERERDVLQLRWHHQPLHLDALAAPGVLSRPRPGHGGSARPVPLMREGSDSPPAAGSTWARPPRPDAARPPRGPAAPAS